MKAVKMVDYYRVIFLSLCCLSILASCNKESDDPGLANVRFAMVDAPGDFDSVIIDVEEVYYNVSGSESDWQSLESFEPGSYDLLKLVNGNEWVLGETSLPEGRLSQVRLVLGSGNRLYKDDSVYFLPVPSGNRSGLKININEFLEGGISYTLILDFDVDKSLVRNGNTGDYTLKPLIRANLSARSGAIKGKVLPSDRVYRVYAVRASDTSGTFSNRSGEFLLRALDPGIYDLTVVNDSGIDLRVEEIAIRAGEVKDLGDLRIF